MKEDNPFTTATVCQYYQFQVSFTYNYENQRQKGNTNKSKTHITTFIIITRGIYGRRKVEHLLRVTATGDGGTATGVRICFCTSLTIVIGCTLMRAWHGVPLQCSVAYIVCGY